MKARLMAIALGLSLSGCAQGRCSLLSSLFGCSTTPRPLPEEDASLSFPHFYETVPFKAGAEGSITELDGRVLRALQLAADDFLPPGDKNAPCWATQAAYTYRVIRQGDILFIRLDEDPARCGRKIAALHSGAQYAIGMDGRILRRMMEDSPPASPQVDSAASEHRGVPATPGEVPPGEATPPPAFSQPQPQGEPSR